jgi:hypothetical protein
MRLIAQITLLLFLQPFLASAQTESINLSGIVVDSASFQPLPYVAIQIKNKSMGLSTKDDGTFSIETNLGDTLVFTRLGHKPLLFFAKKNENDLRIILAEDTRLLKDVTVYGDYNIEGVDDWKKDLPPNTQVKLKNQPLTPEPGTVATFGPGITIGFGGKDKTKNKRDELSKTEVYRKTITSPEVRKQVMELYGISEETFNKKLERFNFQYPEAPYLDSQKEIVTLLIQFFALKD